MNNGGGSRCAAQKILGLLCVGNRRQIIERSGEYSVGRDALIPPGRSIKHLPQTNPAALHTANLPQTCKSSVGDGVCCPVDGPENHDSFIGDMSGFALQTRQVYGISGNISERSKPFPIKSQKSPRRGKLLPQRRGGSALYILYRNKAA